LERRRNTPPSRPGLTSVVPPEHRRSTSGNRRRWTAGRYRRLYAGGERVAAELDDGGVGVPLRLVGVHLAQPVADGRAAKAFRDDVSDTDSAERGTILGASHASESP